MPAFAVTDHGDLGAVPAFVTKAAARGIKPIVGMEAYFVEEAATNIANRVNHRYHLLLLAQDLIGWRNLLRLCSLSWKKNCLMQKLGLVDWASLESHHRGLLCLTGCLAGPIGWSAIEDKPEEAHRFAERLYDLFGERLFIEVYAHGMEEERKAVAALEKTAKRLGRPCVLTNDCHYHRPEDWRVHDVLIKTRFGRPTDFELSRHEYYVKSEEEMRRLGFPSEYADRTLEVADRIELEPEEILSPPPTDDGTETKDEMAVFLGRRRPIRFRRAAAKAAAVLNYSRSVQSRIENMSPEDLAEHFPDVHSLAVKLAPLNERIEPELKKAVVASDIESRIPLRRTQTILFTMWDEKECRRAGARIIDSKDHPATARAAETIHLFFKGMAEYRRRNLDHAVDYFERVLARERGFLNARYQLGVALFYSGRVGEALEHLEELLREAPEFERLPHLLSYLGWCRLRLNRLEEAEDAFQRSLDLKDIPDSRLGLGLTLEQKGQPKRAREILLEFVEKAPDHSRILEAQEALERLARGRA